MTKAFVTGQSQRFTFSKFIRRQVNEVSINFGPSGCPSWNDQTLTMTQLVICFILLFVVVLYRARRSFRHHEGLRALKSAIEYDDLSRLADQNSKLQMSLADCCARRLEAVEQRLNASKKQVCSQHCSTPEESEFLLRVSVHLEKTSKPLRTRLTQKRWRYIQRAEYARESALRHRSFAKRARDRAAELLPKPFEYHPNCRK